MVYAYHIISCSFCHTTVHPIVSANKQHTAGYLMGDLYLYSRGGQLILPRGSLGNWDCCGGPHQQAFKVIKLILSKIEFSLLVLPSTTVPASHVAPPGKSIAHPCVVTSSINNLLLEYINLQRFLRRDLFERACYHMKHKCTHTKHKIISHLSHRITTKDTEKEHLLSSHFFHRITHCYYCAIDLVFAAGFNSFNVISRHFSAATLCSILLLQLSDSILIISQLQFY